MTLTLAGTVIRAWQQEPPPGIPQEPPPLPGGVAAVVRWFFHVPQWIQIGGAVLAALVAAWLGWLVWTRRRSIRGWLSSSALALQAAIALAAALAIFLFAGAARVSWNYMMHDNDFCTACHIMGPAFQRFTDSEHATLSCHDCHRPSIVASSRQLYLWVVDRPEEIGEHAPVPTATCSECHATGRDSTWQRVQETAGHRTHLESDSSALADVMCVTCHGQEIHRFLPADRTCGQAGCHAEADTRIVLGAMTGVTNFHCVTCHEFTRDVGLAVSADSARSGLTPGESQCVSCHEMGALLEPFDAESEPHGALCGSCHDPHRQETPEAALASCTAGGCHAGVDTATVFHRGLPSTALDDCLSCHEAHTWRVEGSACLDCHADILAPRGRAAARSAAAGSPRAASLATGWNGAGSGSAGAGFGGTGTGPAVGWAMPRHLPAPGHQGLPPFDHGEHAELECGACHSSERSHGEIMIRTPEQCAACHHAGGRSEGCVSCHEASELAAAEPPRVAAAMAIGGRTRERSLPFRHADHEAAACADCHTSGSATSAFEPPVACVSCHDEHHLPEARCTACHATVPPEGAHDLSVHTSATCAGVGCHDREGERASDSIERYAPPGSPREACVACHVEQAEHEPSDPCASCHLMPARGGA